MAYMNQERKTKLAPGIRSVLKKYQVKGTIKVRNHSTLIVTIPSGSIDFIGNFNQAGINKYQQFKCAVDNIDVNPYWYHEHFSGVALEFLKELFDAMNVGNHNNSDIQSDYFDVGWYVDVNIGKWDAPYALVA